MMGGSKAGGFTIVETLIVLAISGGMLMSVVFMVSGQQAKSQFQQAIYDVTQKLQQTIDDVANGYYPTSNIQCSASASGPVIVSGNSFLGTNDACVLVGKVIQFDKTKDPQQYIVYSMVSLRESRSVNPIAIAIAPGVVDRQAVPNNSTITNLGNGLSYVSATYSKNSQQKTAAFAVLTSNVFNSGSAFDITGSQSVKLYAVEQTDATISSADNVDIIDKSSNLFATNGFSVCLASGTTNQSGLITIGGSNNRKLSVTLSIKDGKVC